MSEVEDGLEDVLAAHRFHVCERVNADDPSLRDYGSVCSCGDWNAFENDGDHLGHVAAQVREVYLPEVLVGFEALAVQWTTASCQTDGAPCSWHRVAAECADELRAVLAAVRGDGSHR